MTKQKYLTLLISTLGTLLEWAEYTFYGYMAYKISSLYFPEGNQTVNLLKTYGIFAVGYVMRPIGAIIFGHIGDAYGRKTALMIAIFLMGIATLGIGCLPTFAQIGILAPIGLLICRMIQGLAISGEFNGAGIYIIEQIGKQYPNFAGALISASAALGMATGGVAAYLVSLPGMPDWAWRVPFMLGGVSCLLSGYARKHATESAEYLATKDINDPNLIKSDNAIKFIKSNKSKIPIINVIQNYKLQLAKIAALAAFVSIFTYIGNIYIVVFLKNIVNLPAHHAALFAVGGELGAAILIPIMGYLADRHGQALTQFKFGLLSAIFLAPIMFSFAHSGNYLYISLAMFIFAMINGIVSGPVVKILNDQFPANLRYTGISVAWNASVAIFGGTSPMVAHYLASELNWWQGPSYYIVLIAGLTLAFIGWTRRTSLIRCDVAVV